MYDLLLHSVVGPGHGGHYVYALHVHDAEVAEDKEEPYPAPHNTNGDEHHWYEPQL